MYVYLILIARFLPRLLFRDSTAAENGNMIVGETYTPYLTW